MSIIPLSPPAVSTRAAGLDVRPLAYALSQMEPDLRALILPGESWEDMMARREASLDILDDLLAEVVDDLLAEELAEIWRARLAAAEQLLDLVNEELAAAQEIVDRIPAMAEGTAR